MKFRPCVFIAQGNVLAPNQVAIETQVPLSHGSFPNGSPAAAANGVLQFMAKQFDGVEADESCAIDQLVANKMDSTATCAISVLSGSGSSSESSTTSSSSTLKGQATQSQLRSPVNVAYALRRLNVGASYVIPTDTSGATYRAIESMLRTYPGGLQVVAPISTTAPIALDSDMRADKEAALIHHFLAQGASRVILPPQAAATCVVCPLSIPPSVVLPKEGVYVAPRDCQKDDHELVRDVRQLCQKNNVDFNAQYLIHPLCERRLRLISTLVGPARLVLDIYVTDRQKGGDVLLNPEDHELSVIVPEKPADSVTQTNRGRDSGFDIVLPSGLAARMLSVSSASIATIRVPLTRATLDLLSSYVAELVVHDLSTSSPLNLAKFLAQECPMPVTYLTGKRFSTIQTWLDLISGLHMASSGRIHFAMGSALQEDLYPVPAPLPLTVPTVLSYIIQLNRNHVVDAAKRAADAKAAYVTKRSEDLEKGSATYDDIEEHAQSEYMRVLLANLKHPFVRMVEYARGLPEVPSLESWTPYTLARLVRKVNTICATSPQPHKINVLEHLLKEHTAEDLEALVENVTDAIGDEPDVDSDGLIRLMARFLEDPDSLKHSDQCDHGASFIPSAMFQSYITERALRPTLFPKVESAIVNLPWDDTASEALALQQDGQALRRLRDVVDESTLLEPPTLKVMLHPQGNLHPYSLPKLTMNYSNMWVAQPLLRYFEERAKKEAETYLAMSRTERSERVQALYEVSQDRLITALDGELNYATLKPVVPRPQTQAATLAEAAIQEADSEAKALAVDVPITPTPRTVSGKRGKGSVDGADGDAGADADDEDANNEDEDDDIDEDDEEVQGEDAANDHEDAEAEEPQSAKGVVADGSQISPEKQTASSESAEEPAKLAQKRGREAAQLKTLQETEEPTEAPAVPNSAAATVSGTKKRVRM